jgi:DNA end-binding protein Ku
VEPETGRGSNVIDLMAALKKSVGGKEGGGAEAPAKKPAPGAQAG